MRINSIFKYYFDNSKNNKNHQRFITPVINFLGNIELKEISEIQICKFLDLNGFKISSQKVRIAYAAAAVNFAQKMGFIENIKNPFKHVLNKQEQQRMRKEVKEVNLNYSELNRFVEFVTNKTLYNMCKLALNTGIRIEEICNLQWHHVINGYIIFSCNETKEQYCRKIPLLFESQQILNNTVKNTHTQFVFLQKNLKPYTTNNLSRQVSFCFTKFKKQYPDTKPITFNTFHNAFVQTCQLTGGLSKEALLKCCC